MNFCYHGGIGRHAGLKILRELSRVSSSLTDSIWVKVIRHSNREVQPEI